MTDVPVSDWNANYLAPICQKARTEPAPCDCGYVGEWEHRWWYEWVETPGRDPSDRTARRWLAEGLPVRRGGWWCVGGFDERCPGCGDIERFNWQGEQIDRFRVSGTVVPFRRRL